MLELMAYCLAIAALSGATALTAEAAMISLGRPRRWVWLAGIVFAAVFPLFAVVSTTAVATSVALDPITNSPPAQAAGMDGQLHLFSQLDSVLSAIWGLSSLLLLCVLCIGWFRLHLMSRALPTRELLGTSVYLSDVMGPATFGILQPKIVLPRWLIHSAESDICLAIAHEHQHIKARDAATLLFALLLIALMPWNPALWWMQRRLRFAVEADCDQRVLKEGADFAAYGQSLLSIAQRKSAAPLGAVALTETASQLEKRIRAMKNYKRNQGKQWIALAAMTSLSCAAIATQLDTPQADTLIAQLSSAELLAQNDQQADAESITLKFENIPLRALITMIAQFVGEEIVIHDSVEGTVNVNMSNVPWDQALEQILASKGLELVHKDGAMLVQPAI